MAQVVFEHLTFTYPGQMRPALQEVSFSAEAGSFLLLCGPSGCGKTTLLRHLKPALTPVGTRQGRVLLDGMEPSALPAARQASMIAYVEQDPESQLVTDKVWHELAFGLENLGCPPEVIRRRVAEMASFFGITDWFRRDVAILSGGQKQLVNLAAVMTLRPSILLLDEPTSQLDPIAAGRFLDAVGRIHRELGTTILLSEHRLEEAFSMADRVLFLQDGALCCDAPPSDAAAALADGAFADALPTPARIWAAVTKTKRCPVTVAQGRHWLREYAAAHPLSPVPFTSTEPPLGEVAAVLDKVWFRYTREGEDVLRGLCLRAAKGQILALLGGNGAGKTTTLQLLSGARKPYRGGVTVSGKVCLLPQNPRSLFLRRTLGEDLQETASAVGSWLLPQLCDRCRIAGLLTRHPDDLSGGELQRAALCKLLLLQPEVLLLDEPTKGLDAPFKAELAALLRQLTASGTAVVLVSHDLEFCAQYADRCALLFDGQVVSEDATRRFFAQNRFYTTAAARMAQPLLPEAMTAADVIAACGGTSPEPVQILPEPPQPPKCPASSGSELPHVPASKPVGQATGRSRFLVGALLLAMPLTLLLGSTLLDNRRYLFISLLLVLEALATAVVRMEGRRPAARELAVLAAMCALAVLGRTAFFMLPQFKPLLALVILTGMAFGTEAGFLVGAAAMLISDMLLGQGPWTPYQMVAAGLVGALAGGLTRMGILGRGRIGMCLYGALSALVIYGGILNPVSLLLFQPNPTVAMVLAAYAAGLPMDLIHAAATACFLALIGPAVLEKLHRLRVKYGI